MFSDPSDFLTICPRIADARLLGGVFIYFFYHAWFDKDWITYLNVLKIFISVILYVRKIELAISYFKRN
jgi:hypothetical protein